MTMCVLLALHHHVSWRKTLMESIMYSADINQQVNYSEACSVCFITFLSALHYAPSLTSGLHITLHLVMTFSMMFFPPLSFISYIYTHTHTHTHTHIYISPLLFVGQPSGMQVCKCLIRLHSLSFKRRIYAFSLLKRKHLINNYWGGAEFMAGTVG